VLSGDIDERYLTSTRAPLDEAVELQWFEEEKLRLEAERLPPATPAVTSRQATSSRHLSKTPALAEQAFPRRPGVWMT
jgi:hypothetical protein